MTAGAQEEVSGLAAHLGYWLRLVSNQVSHAFRLKVEASGVSVSEWVVLRELYGPDSGSPGALVQSLGMTKGAVSKLIDRLENKGLATRSPSQVDRRQQAVALTAEGRALVPRLAALADANDQEFFGRLPRQARDELLRVLQEIARTHHITSAPVD